MFSWQKILISGLLIASFTIPSKLTVSGDLTLAQSATPASSITQTQPTLIVVAASPAAAVAPLSNDACTLSVPTLTNLVQDTGYINFNQPASCFTINHQQLSLQPNLQVVMASSPGVIKLAARPAATLNHLKAAEPSLPTLPVLPPTAASLLFLLGLASVDPVNRRLQTAAAQFKHSLTLSQLQMLRC